MARRSPGGLTVRVVLVPGGAGVGDARRRVLDMLLAAARAAPINRGDGAAPPAAPEEPANPPRPAEQSGEQAA